MSTQAQNSSSKEVSQLKQRIQQLESSEQQLRIQMQNPQSRYELMLSEERDKQGALQNEIKRLNALVSQLRSQLKSAQDDHYYLENQ